MSTYDKMLKDTKRNKTCVAMKTGHSNEMEDSGWKMLDDGKKPEPTKWPKVPNYKKKALVRTPTAPNPNANTGKS